MDAGAGLENASVRESVSDHEMHGESARERGDASVTVTETASETVTERKNEAAIADKRSLPCSLFSVGFLWSHDEVLLINSF